MPNWACGVVSVTGTKQNVINFVSRFIYEADEETGNPKPRYFLRSFANVTRQDVLGEIEDVFSEQPIDSVFMFSLNVNFAWSVCNCIIDQYPQEFPRECITLEEACTTDQVYVEIMAEESSERFEEYITCDADGNCAFTSSDLMPYQCLHCGEVSYIASFTDIEDYECCECGKEGSFKKIDIEADKICNDLKEV